MVPAAELGQRGCLEIEPPSLAACPEAVDDLVRRLETAGDDDGLALGPRIGHDLTAAGGTHP